MIIGKMCTKICSRCKEKKKFVNLEKYLKTKKGIVPIVENVRKYTNRNISKKTKKNI
jgi:hypothetical protein